MQDVPRIPGRHLPFASRIKHATGALTMAPGLVTEAKHAEQILQGGDVDLMGMARELMNRSEWPVHAARELGVPDYLELFPPDFTYRLKQRQLSDRLRGPDG